MVTISPPLPVGIGGESCVSKNAGSVGLAVGVRLAVAVAVGRAVCVAVDGGVAVAVGGTGVDGTVGRAVAVKVADGRATAIATVGGVVVGFTGPQDASRMVSAAPTTRK